MTSTRRTWSGPARRCWPMAAPAPATSSPASCWRCSAILSWRAVPEMPVEIMLLPRWFPIHLDKISYWARTVIVPLLVLRRLEAAGAESARRHHRRAVPAAAADHHQAGARRAPEGALGDVLLRPRPGAARGRAALPERPRRRAIDKAVAFVDERLNGEDGLGGIFPAMVNSVMMYAALGIPADHPRPRHRPRRRSRSCS